MEIKIDKKVEKFLLRLDKKVIAKVLRLIDLLERFGYKLGMPQSKKIMDNIFELRIHGKQEVRILYTFKKSIIILLHGFIKKSQKISKQELSAAIKRLKDLT
jgi:phage-related protein